MARIPLPAAAGFSSASGAVMARRMAKLAALLPLLGVLLVAGCGGGRGPGASAPLEQAQVAALAEAIRGLGPDVDPGEAERAARIAHEYPLQLAKEYGVTDPPLIHNTKVNLMLRPRGLCWHWAEDMQERLEEEAFETLSLHRAIATPDMPFGGDHSTVIVSHRGGTMYDGIVLDPWRGGGVLHWMPTVEDADYDWRPRGAVLEHKRRLRARYARRLR